MTTTAFQTWYTSKTKPLTSESREDQSQEYAYNVLRYGGILGGVTATVTWATNIYFYYTLPKFALLNRNTIRKEAQLMALFATSFHRVGEMPKALADNIYEVLFNDTRNACRLIGVCGPKQTLSQKILERWERGEL
jgi:hypothetical protein